VALGQVYLSAFPVSNIPPLLRTDILMQLVYEGQAGEAYDELRVLFRILGFKGTKM
jgi:hypothetical protein